MYKKCLLLLVTALLPEDPLVWRLWKGAELVRALSSMVISARMALS